MRGDAADAPELEAGREPSFLYDAFISYDHDDRPVAQGIQRGLHRIGRRLGRLHALRVFRDSTDLTASPDLWGKVTEAMDRSRYLIVVLSPHAAASTWVNKEVAHWLEHRGPDRLMFVMAGGSLVWEEDGARFDPDRSDAALPVLTQPGVLAAEPLYVDVSGDAPWDPDAALFREKVTDLAAPIHGKPKYELASEDLREQRRFRRLKGHGRPPAGTPNGSVAKMCSTSRVRNAPSRCAGSFTRGHLLGAWSLCRSMVVPDNRRLNHQALQLILRFVQSGLCPAGRSSQCTIKLVGSRLG